MMKKISLLLFLLISTNLLAQDPYPFEGEFNIENRAVREYMPAALETYSSNKNYSLSIVTKYNDSRYGSKLYWPAGKEISWRSDTPASNISEIHVLLADNTDFVNASSYIISDKSVRSYTLRNMIPGKTYFYNVEEHLTDGSVNRVKGGQFRTTGQVRMVQVLNCSNIRDIGGWKSSLGENTRVRYGKLYRSGSLNRITSEGRHEFAENMGVVAELDLRHEVNQSYTTLGKGGEYDYRRRPHEAGVKGLTQCKTEYRDDFRFILSHLRKGHGVDWHCAIGCDRCGALSFLIEGLLGLNDVDLSRDFELSTFSLKSNNKRPRAHIKSMLDYIRKQGASSDDLTTCFYKYWRGIGVSDSDIREFRGYMLEGYTEDATPSTPISNTYIKVNQVPTTEQESKPYNSPESFIGNPSKNNYVPTNQNHNFPKTDDPHHTTH